MTHIRSFSVASTSTTRSDSSQSVLNSSNLACQLYDSGYYLAAYEQFSVCALTAKYLFNRALCLRRNSQPPPESSRLLLIDATTIDPYFVPGWLLLAEMCVVEKEWQNALGYLKHAKLGMRSTTEMDFRQLGLCVVVKLSYILLLEATCYRELQEWKVANDLALTALQGDPGAKQMVCKWFTDRKAEFEFIEWDLFRPTPLKLAALEPNDYLGSALLVASNTDSLELPILLKCQYKGEACRWVERDASCLSMSYLKSQVIRKLDIQGNCKILTRDGKLLIDDQDLKEALANQNKLRLNIVEC